MKKLLYPVMNDRSYRWIQAVSKAWDIRTGSWSEPELELIPYAVEPGDTVFDIGANFGMWCYHLSPRVGNGKIYAFEPVPFTYKTLRHVARLLRFRNVQIVPKGCSDKAGEITFMVPVQDSGMVAAGLAYRGGRNDDRAGKETQVRWGSTRDIKAEVISIDEYLPSVERLSLIKCDIEGAELFAFRGAERMIDQHLPSVICEINPWYLEGFGIRLDELTGFFFAKGYEIFRYRNDNVRGRLYPVKVSEVEEENYTFIHPSRRERFAALLG